MMNWIYIYKTGYIFFFKIILFFCELEIWSGLQITAEEDHQTVRSGPA